MLLRRLIAFVSIIAVAACIYSCSSATDEPVPATSGTENVVTLDLSVSVLEAIDPQSLSRAYSGDNTFEQPATKYEKLNTLRVVIVHENGKIEHNRMVTYNQATGLINHDNLQFEVSSGETKKIYLFGNEKFIATTNSFDFGTRMVVGTDFPSDDVEDLLLKMNGSASVIDNFTPTTARTFIPMSEAFDVKVDKPQAGSTGYQTEHLFITRSLIKFSFNIKVDTRFQNGTFLSGIKLSGLGDRSYYLPHGTEYNPPKGEESTFNYGGRFIEKFVTPIFDLNRVAYTFPLLQPIDMSKTGETPIEQYVYFPETKDGKYQVSLQFLGKDFEYMDDLFAPQSLQLTDIPRNTHVKVNITFKSYDVHFEVDLVPYIGVYLDPVFGKGDQANEGN